MLNAKRQPGLVTIAALALLPSLLLCCRPDSSRPDSAGQSAAVEETTGSTSGAELAQEPSQSPPEQPADPTAIDEELTAPTSGSETQVLPGQEPSIPAADTAATAGQDAPSLSASSTQPRILAPEATPEAISALSFGNGNFAFELYHAVRAQQSGNLFFSPYSISVALTMTYAGARGETANQMASTLHLPQSDILVLYPVANALDQTLNSRAQSQAEDEATGQRFQLNIANALWGQTGYAFLPDFLDALAVNFGAGMHLVDFGNTEQARQTINGWVSEQTAARIPELLAEGILTALTRLVLTNAVYFNASWDRPFEVSATEDAPFNLLDGSQVTVPMMVQTNPFGYSRGASCQVVVLPYVGRQVSMAIVLPDEGQFATVEAGLTGPAVQDMIEAATSERIRLFMPRFRTESGLGLSATLAQMGMPDAFSIDAADFSGMTGGRDLYISDVIHQAFVSVDEAGTEAAAATAVIMALRSMAVQPPAEVRIDRPFIVLIRDNETGTILFLGRVLNPVAS